MPEDFSAQLERAKLDAMERELFKKTGRLDEIRREVGLEERPSADDNAKSKIVDRLKELIKFKGFQVAPAELEALMRERSKEPASG